MLKLNKNLAQRIFYGLTLGLGALATIMLTQYGFLIIGAFLAMASVREFHKLTNNESHRVNVIIPSIAAITLFVAFHIKCSGYDIEEWILDLIWTAYGIQIAGLFIWELYRKQENPVANWAYIALGQGYAALPFAMLNYIFFYSLPSLPILVVSVFIVIWTNDSFAYFVGSAIGKHRLFERISPKKSWEGFFGGAVGALLAGYILSIFVPELELWQWQIFSQIVVIFGTLGDLIESLLKRTIGVKDSGNAIPGHGGWLDRFDSMLLAAPMVVFFLYLIK